MSVLHSFARTPSRRIAAILGAFLASCLLVPAAAAADERFLEVYDVSDLLRPVPDFPAPRLGLSGLEEAPAAEEPAKRAWTMEELVELIREALGAEIAASGGSVDAIGSSIVVSLPAAAQGKVAAALGTLRHGAPADLRTYTIEARWVALPAAAIAELGIEGPAAGRPARAKRVGAKAATELLAALGARADAKHLSAPRLTVLANQLSHCLMVDQEAFVDRLEVDAEGVADPVIAILYTGFTIETRVVPRRGRDGIILLWEAQVARPLPLPGGDDEGAEAAAAPLEPELGVPEVVTVVREGRTALAPGEVVVVQGLPSEDPELATLLVISWTEGEAGAPAAEER